MHHPGRLILPRALGRMLRQARRPRTRVLIRGRGRSREWRSGLASSARCSTRNPSWIRRRCEGWDGLGIHSFQLPRRLAGSHVYADYSPVSPTRPVSIDRGHALLHEQPTTDCALWQSSRTGGTFRYNTSHLTVLREGICHARCFQLSG